MRLLSNLLAASLMVLIVPLVTLAACNAALITAITSEATYASTFEDPRIYEDLIPLAMPAIFRAANQNLDDDVIFLVERAPAPIKLFELNRLLDTQDWRTISGLLIPPEWLEEVVGQALSVTLGILEGDLGMLNETLDVAEVRRRLMGEEAEQVADVILEAVPSCVPSQLEALQDAQDGRGGPLPLCRPEDEALLSLSRQTLLDWMGSLASNLQEDEIRVGDLFPRDNARALGLLVELDRRINALFYLCPLALASLMLVFSIRSWRGFGRWIGTTLFLCAAAIIALTIAGQAAVIDSASSVLRDASSSDIDQFFSQILVGLIRSGFLQASGVLLTQSALLGGLGFVLLALTVWLPNRRVTGQQVIITEDGQVFSTASGEPLTGNLRRG